ncbi:MAG: DUF192 domain-containing protein [Candidatus Binatia bacterium]
MPALNLTKKTWLATTVRKADSFFTRLVGLLRRQSLGPEEALWLIPSKGVHTIGMKFPIDVVFLDRNHRVIATICEMQPRRMSRIHFSAQSVLELPRGVIKKSSTTVGDQLEILLAESSEMDDLKDTLLNRVG